MGSWSHCCGGPDFGGMLHLLCFQEMLREKEEAQESKGEEDRPSQKGKGRRRRSWREGVMSCGPFLDNLVGFILSQ